MKKPHITLSDRKKRELEKKYKREKDRRIASRLLCTLLIADGKTYEEISSFLRVDIRTIERWVSVYKNHGLKELCSLHYDNHGFNSSKLTKKQEDEIKQHLKKIYYKSAKELASYIERTYNVRYTPSTARKLLKRLGFSFKKLVPIPGKADAKRQQEFLDKYKKMKKKCGPKDKIYFVDASHFLHNAVPGYAWLPIGTPLYIPTNTGRKRVTIIGAYNPDETKFLYIETQEKCNANRIKELMDLLKETNPQAEQIILILDNARYNHARAVKEYAKELGITLEFLPPYSPNLNLIERFWRFMKTHIVKNCYYSIFEQFIAKIREFLDNLSLYKEELTSLMREKFNILDIKNATF